jgi:hypothetical protein
MESSEQSRAVVQGIYDAVMREDTATFFNSLHPQFKVDSAPCFEHGGPDSSIEEWQQMLAGLAPVLDINGLTLMSLIADGDQVSATARVKLHSSDEEVLFCENWIIKDGKAFRMRVYCYDPAVLLTRLTEYAQKHETNDQPLVASQLE